MFEKKKWPLAGRPMHLLFLLLGMWTLSCESPQRRVILVETGLNDIPELSQELDNLVGHWRGDGIEADEISILTVDPGETAVEVRQKYSQKDLDGVLLVGNIPSWEINGVYTDLLYQLPGLKIENGSLKGSPSKVVGVGRLSAYFPTGTANTAWERGQKTIRYLRKLNTWWSNYEQNDANRALLYVDSPFGRADDGNGNPQRTDEQAILQAWPQDRLTAVFDPDFDTDITTVADFRSRLDDGFEWITLGVHGSSNRQAFESGRGVGGGSINTVIYEQSNPNVDFFYFQSCQNGNYRLGATDIIQNIPDHILYSTDHTVAVFAHAASVWAEDIEPLYYHMAYGQSMGRSMAFRNRDLFKADAQNNSIPLGSVSRSLTAPTLFGDPFLRIHWRPVIEKVIAYDTSGRDDANSAALLAGGAAGIPATQLQNKQRLIQFLTCPYGRDAVQEVRLLAYRNGVEVPIQGEVLSSTKDRFGAIAFDPQAGEGTLRYAVQLVLDNGRVTSLSDPCGPVQGRYQELECD